MLKSALEELREGRVKTFEELQEVFNALDETLLRELGRKTFGTIPEVEWTGHEEVDENEKTLEREFIIDSGGDLYIAGWLTMRLNDDGDDNNVDVYFWGGVFIRTQTEDVKLTEGVITWRYCPSLGVWEDAYIS